MAQGQLIGMEQTYQPLQWMLKGFFQSPDNARGVSRVHICAVTPYNLQVLRLRIQLVQTNDSVMSLLEPDCGVVWLKYEEPGSVNPDYVFFRESLSVVLVMDADNLCQSLILSTIKEYFLYAIVVKLVTILLEFFTTFPAFSADLASIDYFRPVDRRHLAKIVQN